MIALDNESITQRYFEFLQTKTFPCVAAKAAVSKGQVRCFVAGHMACPKDDADILNFLYTFVDEYRKSESSFHSAAVIFQQPVLLDDEAFDQFLWQRLKSFNTLDKQKFSHDSRVDSDPASGHFSFSIGGEAFFVIGLHPGSERKARKFDFPALIFNPHAEFEKLRQADRYEKMKQTVRKRDEEFSGSVNPLLEDYGTASEVFQYSGLKHDQDWKCPL